jgi:hypothetical protein
MPSPNAIPTSAPRRALSALGHVLGTATLLALVLILAGKLLSDRFHWSQYLSWTPTLLACLGGSITLVLAWCLTRPRRNGRWVRRAGWLLVITGVLYTTQIEWAGGSPPLAPAREQRLRVVFWNFGESADAGWETPAIIQDPDLVVVRAGTCTDPNGLRARMGADAYFCWEQGFMVVSRLPILAWGSGPLNVSQGLGLDPRETDLIRTGRDPGRAMWLILDATTRLGRHVVVWLVDMPSDLSLSRVTAMKEARAAMEAGPKVHWIEDAPGEWAKAPNAALANKAFQSPDLILGDFNTPHRSHSLSFMAQGFTSAYDQAGLGHAATFPRTWALWQLDQAFLAPTLRACAHDALDAGSGSHRMLVVDIENPSATAR